MAKKLASGTRYMVLDVKVGSGAFMDTLERARELATLMVQIGVFHDRQVTTLLTSMNEPLGWAVGNAVEVNEAVACLKGQGPEDLRQLVVALAGALEESVHGTSPEESRQTAKTALDGGHAWDVFRRWIAAQGGNVAAVEAGLPLAGVVRHVMAPHQGWVREMNTQSIGEVALELGAGRHALNDPVDWGVGLICQAKIGSRFESGEIIGTVYARNDDAADAAAAGLTAAIGWSAEPISPPPLVLEQIKS
jgi:pyrimidine-nucleoside phosphorylase